MCAAEFLADVRNDADNDDADSQRDSDSGDDEDDDDDGIQNGDSPDSVVDIDDGPNVSPSEKPKGTHDYSCFFDWVWSQIVLMREFIACGSISSTYARTLAGGYNSAVRSSMLHHNETL